MDTEISIRDEYYTLDWIMEGLLTRAGFTIKKAEYTDGFMAFYLCEKQPILLIKEDKCGLK